MNDSQTNMDEVTPRRTGRVSGMVAVALLAFLAGLALAAWVVRDGRISAWLVRGNAPAGSPASLPTASKKVTLPATAPDEKHANERLTRLEHQLAQMDLRTQAISGDAARAGAMLTAFAARRLIEQGQPLGYIEGQVRLHFGDSQPNATETLIAVSQAPVTRQQLLTGLDALQNRLVERPANAGTWSSLRSELSSLFVIRKETNPSNAPDEKLDRARQLLASGQTTAAIATVEQMPGASSAHAWLGNARRYAATQHALDQIEAAAILAPARSPAIKP